VAQFPQNLSSGSAGVPQAGQTLPSGLAHWTQNFRPALFSVPQFEQITPSPASHPFCP
jgi:hypothetical protein